MLEEDVDKISPILLPAVANYLSNDSVDLPNISERLKREIGDGDENVEESFWDAEGPELTEIVGTDCKEVILPCVYAYLVARSHPKTAKRLRKAEPEQEWDMEDIPSLDKIFLKWNKKQEKIRKKAAIEEEKRIKRERDEAEVKALLKNLEPLEKKRRLRNADDPPVDSIASREFNQREDWDKWKNALEGADKRLVDGNYRAGDEWGNQAATDLGKVRGKGFRKEMAKKKRSSWRGGGALDQGCNSFKFDDDSD